MPAKSLLARLGLSTGLSHLTPEIQAQSKDHYILIGLHTCGDLASTMFRTFNENDNIVGLVSVGCCYMKLSCDMPCNASHDSHSGGYLGYPLSTFVHSVPKHVLSYEAREVACHSRDVYMKKLQGRYIFISSMILLYIYIYYIYIYISYGQLCCYKVNYICTTFLRWIQSPRHSLL